MGITSLFGLPAHIFLVHIPVVLVPLVGIGTVLMLWPKLRTRFGFVVAVLALVAAVSTILATGSGKALRRYVTRSSLVRAHTSIGGNLQPWVILLTVVVLAAVAFDWWTKRQSGEVAFAGHSLTATAVQRVGLGLSVLAVVLAGVSGSWVYRIGHSGAKASWAVVQHRIDTHQQVGGDSGR
jgi:hypothetical protein